MEKWYTAVCAYIHDHRQEMVSDLMTLVRIPSVAKHGKDGLPFGKDVDDLLQAAAEIFRRDGFEMQVSHERGYALAVCEGEGDGIGVFAHGDVVPVTDDWIKTKPFEPMEENDLLYGRGVSDNKSGIVEALYALRALRAAGVPIKSRVTVYVGGCEEAGMQDIENYVENERMPAVSIVPDGGFPLGVGEKGILRADCRSKEALRDVIKLDGGDAYNVILNRVQVALRSGEAYTVEGVPGHASSPAGSVNAAQKAAQQLLTMPICDGDKKILSDFAEAIGDYYGGNLQIASEGAFGKLTCANGITRVEDGHLVFTLDIRYGVEMGADALVEKLGQALEEKGFTLTVDQNQPGFLLDENTPEAQIILDVCRQLLDKPEAKPVLKSFGTYARMLKNAYSVENAPLPKPQMPKGRGGAHQSDEALFIPALLKGTEALAVMIARLDAHLC